MEKIRPLFRWLVLLATLLLPIVYYVPIWSIQLWAPQYPEGLQMLIWINNLSGNVDVINDLNHYIGMGKINIDMFPEFGYMVYILGVVIFVSLLTFILNKRFMLYILSVLLIMAAVAALIDFYRWEYYYGHHLNPMAAIIIEGQSYQPPLIGYKQLLNFTALSMPHIGGWILFGSGGLMVLSSIFEFRNGRKFPKERNIIMSCKTIFFQLKKKFAKGISFFLFFALLFPSCQSGPESIQYGKESCTFCKMQLMDSKFGAELVTEKGKVYKFDDTGCMLSYEIQNLGTQKIAQELVIDYSNPGTLINAATAFHVKLEGAKSPMGSNLISFEKEEKSTKYVEVLKGKKITWTEIKQSYSK